MRPINPYLGASSLRTSRVSYIDVQGKAWDSVVFQQSKSILDFDLNTMQRILQESVSQLSRTLFTSGFVNNSSMSLSGTTITLADSRVNFFGTVARVADAGSITHCSSVELIADVSMIPSACKREAAAPGATLLMCPDVKAPRPEYQLISRSGIGCFIVSK